MSDELTFHPTYNSDFIKHIYTTPADELTIEHKVSLREDPNVGADDAEVYRVFHGEESAYFVDIGREGGKKTRQNNRVEKLLIAHKLAFRLGAHIPTAVFGEDWWMLRDFDGEKIIYRDRETALDILRQVNRTQFEWDCAKLFILGHRDLGAHNLLMTERGQYVFIDLQSLNSCIKGEYDRFVVGLMKTIRRLNMDVQTFRRIEKKTIGIAEYLDENREDLVLTPEIESNIECIADEVLFKKHHRLPENESHEIPDPTSTIPPVDELPEQVKEILTHAE